MSPEEAIAALVGERLAHRRAGDPPFVLGLCGAQGSGKSTIADRLTGRFGPSAVLSLDDLYHRKATRQQLAQEVHPLFATRGVPGTHDVVLGVETISAIRRGEAVRLPRFDKAIDDRAPVEDWPHVPQDCALLIFEGWCVGARAQQENALLDPINALEAEEDGAGNWRRCVNESLARHYPMLFAPLDALVLLLPPDWPTVLAWRSQQEDALRAVHGAGGSVMDARQLARFVAHYERVTRHIWDEMPLRADLCLRLDRDRKLLSCSTDARHPSRSR